MMKRKISRNKKPEHKEGNDECARAMSLESKATKFMYETALHTVSTNLMEQKVGR